MTLCNSCRFYAITESGARFCNSKKIYFGKIEKERQFRSIDFEKEVEA